MSKAKSSQVDKAIEQVIKRFPCRDEVIAGLERRLTKLKWPFLLINGPHSTGKTSITRALLETLDLPFSWTNCLEIESLKCLQKKILYDLDIVNSPEVINEERATSRVASNEIFIQQLVEGLEKLTAKHSKIKVVRGPKTQTKTPTKTPTKSATKRSRSETNNPTYTVESKPCRFFIVLDNYDKLVSSNINILTTLSQVHEMMRDKVRLITIMITALYHDQLLYSFSLIPKPIVYTFPNFNPKSLPQVISSIVTEDCDETYCKFSQIVCQTLSASINDPKKLSFISEESFMDHINMFDDKGLTSEEVDKQLRKCFLEKVEDYVHSAISFGGSNQSTSSSTMQELPKSTKYLLISAFLASYNTKASDKKFFVIRSDKRKVSRSTTKKEQAATAPKLFPLERLLHIYESLLYLNESGDHNLKETQLNQPTNQLLSQIETLVNLKLLVKVNSVTISPLSSLIKYQISDFITYEFIDSLAKSVGIQLQGHMNF